MSDSGLTFRLFVTVTSLGGVSVLTAVWAMALHGPIAASCALVSGGTAVGYAYYTSKLG